MIGLLWYDKTKPIVEVILDAADRFEQRFGRLPILVMINEHEYVTEDLGLIVKPDKSICRHFVWIA